MTGNRDGEGPDRPPLPAHLPPRGAPRRGWIFSGRRLIWLGAVLVLVVSAYVMVRIKQASRPRPPASEIPRRPERKLPP